MLFRDTHMEALWKQMKYEPLSEGQIAVIRFVERWAGLIEAGMATVEGSTALAVFPHTFIDRASKADTDGLTESELDAAISLAGAVLVYGAAIKEHVTSRAIYGKGRS